ncbi:MAG: beta-lactamase family protein [Marinilabiliales bacterium]|nr:beta-lactamase family protein [Marinilabiliales bacterium]
MAALKVPGVSVAVIDGDKIAWAKGYGVLEAGSPAPVTEKTMFQAASISKSVTAMAAMRLVERGQARPGRGRQRPAQILEGPRERAHPKASRSPCGAC